MANGLFSLFPHLVEASVAQAKNVLEQDPYAKQNNLVFVTVLFIAFLFLCITLYIYIYHSPEIWPFGRMLRSTHCRAMIS